MLLSPEPPKTTALPLQVALPTPKPRRRRWPAVVALLALGGVAAFALDAPIPGLSPAPRSPDALPTPLSAADIVGLARLMPEGDLVHVAPPHGGGDARVAALHVAVGDRVRPGALLATLDNLPTLRAALLSAEAEVAQRDAALVQAQEAVRVARLEAQAAVAEAQIAAEAAEARRARGEVLAERGTISAAALDDLDAAAAQARQALARSHATLERWDTGDPAAHPDVIAATRALEAAQIEHDRAQSDLSRGEVRAPIVGTVLEISVRPGERPGTEGVATMGQTDRMVARAEVFQLDIGQVRLGQRVVVTAAAIDAPLVGHVERVGLLVGRQNLVSDDTAANTDARVVEVIVRLDPESSARAAHLSNLEALARISTEDRL